MKNVVLLVVDSFCNDIIGESKYGKSATPFLDGLKEKCVYAENLYSQGPYTEAGLKGLLCGQNVMDEGGYMYRFNNISNFIFDPFYDAGYEIYNAYYPGQLYGEKISKKISHKYYTQGFDYRGYWMFRIQYYIDISARRALTREEKEELVNMYQILFACMEDFYGGADSSMEAENTYYFIRGRIDNFDMHESARIIREQKKMFLENQEKYVLRVLEEGKNHILFSMKQLPFTEPIENRALERIWREERGFWRKCAGKAFLTNVKNSSPNVGKLVASLKSENKYYFYNWIYRLNSARDYKKFLTKKEIIPIPSMGKQVQFMLRTLGERSGDPDKPFLYMLHVEEAHYFNTFLSYDVDDYELLKEETELLKADLKGVNGNYRGYLQYRQAMVYIDHWIKKLFEGLEKQGISEDTIVLITADHGSSYCYEPLRDERLVTNSHTANYHIPMFLYDSDTAPRSIRGFYTSKDVIPTLLEVCGIEKVPGFKGISMLSDRGEPSVCNSEYLGTGCPDIRMRPIQYVVRNKKYVISYEAKAGDEFEQGRIKEIYDREKDEDETVNLIEHVDRKEINDLVSFLEDRHREIHGEYLEKYGR